MKRKWIYFDYGWMAATLFMTAAIWIYYGNLPTEFIVLSSIVFVFVVGSVLFKCLFK